MFEDLVKIAAFGYVGSKMSQEMSKRMDERKREQAEALQQLKNFAFVVYDGKAPYTDAQNLVKYLKDKGYDSAAVDPELYHSRLEQPPIMEYSRIIIIGHHDFTKEQMTTVDLQSDQYGLKFGATGRRYVLRARRSDLSSGKKGRKEFAAYYNQEMLNYRELAEKYGVPMTFGYRSETRESQYDLLWLKCAQSIREELDMERTRALVDNYLHPSHRT